MTIGNYWQAASIFPTMGRKRLQARIFARWHRGSRICRKSGLGLRARGRGSSFLSAWALEEQGGTPEQRPTFIVSPPRYFACQRGCYETTPFSPCRYWPKHILAPGTLRIVFGAWEPWRAPPAPCQPLGTSLAPAPRVSRRRLPALPRDCFFAGLRLSPAPLALEAMGESVPPHPLPRVGGGDGGWQCRAVPEVWASASRQDVSPVRSGR